MYMPYSVTEWTSPSGRTEPYLYLSVVTDGFHRDGGSDQAFWVPGLELDDSLGPAHKPRHAAPVLEKLFLLILEESDSPIKSPQCLVENTFSVVSRVHAPEDSAFQRPPQS